MHVWLPEAHKTSLAIESPGIACLCNRSICMAHLFKRAQEQGTAVVLGPEECWSCYLLPSKAEQPATELLLWKALRDFSSLGARPSELNGCHGELHS